MGKHAPGYQNEFFVPRERKIEIFQNNAHFPNLGRSFDECHMMAISMLKPTAQCQKLLLIFRERKLYFLGRSTSLGQVVDVTAETNICLIVYNKPSSLPQM